MDASPHLSSVLKLYFGTLRCRCGREASITLTYLAEPSKVLQKNNEQVYLRMVEQTKQIAVAHMPMLKRDLTEFAKSIKHQINTESSSKPVDRVKQFNIVGIAVIATLFGIFIGSTWFGQGTNQSREEEKKLEMGNSIAKVIPLLDKTTKDKIIQLMEENSK
ncbi:hypothetical protein [Solimicrobium silvestre]|uniref:Uncharacterized protein n=1 Tax=Solimicrobium silvestre TaxID=2099400 RepID=A0A2S9H2U3_9BURK|nr:hypothetical protein [Solimicrobium silvestre]PRC94302.1 hypothetical protein S2091_0923 [Solimicrobium silvestre]